jgi:methylglutaconyl-CoA hydratase
MTQSQVSDFLDSLRGLVGELEQLKIPTIAVVDGFALGGGTELALGCDLRVGGESRIRPLSTPERLTKSCGVGKDTVMALPETKLGIIPGAGGTQRLTKLVGVSKAKELIFTGRRLTGEEAERIGESFGPTLYSTCIWRAS